MADASFKNICAHYGIAAEICDRFPDAVVLFHMSGRCDMRDYFPCDDAAISLKTVPENLPNRLKSFSMPKEHEELFRFLRDREHLSNKIDSVFNEISPNAQIYGFDASIYPRVSGNGLTNESALCFTGVSELPEGHQSVILAYSDTARQICLLVQNFASSGAAEKLKSHYERVNHFAARGIQMPEGQIDLDVGIQEHAADPSDQPLLQKGGPIGPVNHPVASLASPHIHATARCGNFLARSFTDGMFADDTPAPFSSHSDFINEETVDALNLAIKRSGLRPEDVRSVTVGAVFSLES